MSLSPGSARDGTAVARGRTSGLLPMADGAERLEVGEVVAPAMDLGHDVVDVGGLSSTRRVSPACFHWQAGWRSSCCARRLRQSLPYPRCVVVPPPHATQRPGREVMRGEFGQGWELVEVIVPALTRAIEP